ncbi:MAG: RrF2 family transcriptional regulator [Chitinispirillaceae bacterium]|nr:RrF2 family transcriptional regulator [Chitinispirillaceae bacterium]
MKLSTKCRYGLRAALEIARQYGRAPVKRKEIARKEGVSSSYLENILLVLRNRKIVKTARGVNGGYVLCRPPSAVSVFEIVSALEGPLSIVDCIDEPAGCRKSGRCLTRPVWRELAETIRESLRKISLQELLEREKKAGSLEYSI